MCFGPLRAKHGSDLSDLSDRERTTLTGRRMRPSPIGHAWIWIVLTVGVVILMTITLWVVHHATASKDPFVDASGDWRVRWAQVPGPADEYAHQAIVELGSDRRAEAAMWMSKSLALNPQQIEVWRAMVCLSVVHQGPYTLDDKAIQRLLSGPLDESMSIDDWVSIRARAQDEPDRGFAWLMRCSSPSAPQRPVETTPGTLDTVAAPQ